MPSDVPQEGRCGAKVVSKVGLEIHDHELDMVFVDSDAPEGSSPKPSLVVGEGDEYDPEDAFYDAEMVQVVVTDGEHEQEVDPTWDDVLPLLRQEWTVAAIVREIETDDAIDYERVEILDSDPYVTNRGTHLDGYCLRYPMDNGRCYVHQGGAEKDHTYNMKHGLYATRSKFIRWLEEEGRTEDREFIEIMVDSWLDDAPFDRSNTAKVNELYRIAVDQLRLWYAVDEFVDTADEPGTSSGEYSGLAYKQIIGMTDEGDPIEALDENPLNLPYSRLDRDVQKKLKDMGIYDSPEKQGAEATMSLAQALSNSGGDNR